MEFLNIKNDPHHVTFTLILCEYYSHKNAYNFLKFWSKSNNFFLNEAQNSGCLLKKTEILSEAQKNGENGENGNKNGKTNHRRPP